MARQLAYFPTPYPDELLYSVFARYHTRSCNISISQTLQDLFGESNVTLDNLPSRLTDLVDRLPSQSALTPARFVQEHTMLPYYKPFIAPEWLDTPNLDAYDEEMKARVMSIAYNIRKRKDLHQTLHFCPKCYESDELTYGEPYWHRSHQVLGILRCHRHETWLINSKIAIKSIGPHHPLISLGSKALSDTSSAQSEFASEANLHDWLAKEVYWLINGNYTGGIPCHPTILQSRYHQHLEKMGLICSNTGLLRKGELLRRFENLFRGKLPIEIYYVYDGNFTSDWLARFFLAGFREHRPIIHLLMMRFFGIDSKEILWDKIEAVKPFGKGPWPCLNKVADHYLQSVVKNCSISKSHTSTNLVTGTFKCECGFQYERLGPDLSERNRTRFDKIVATGGLWDKKLMNLFLNDDADVASTLGVPQSFIVQRLPLLLENETDKLSIGNFVKIRKRHRNKWQEICEKFLRGYSVEILDWKGEILQRWFSKYDAEWFKKNCPPTVLEEPNLNWAELDSKLATMVSFAAETLRQQMRKVSKGSIGRLIDDLLNINYLYRVPITQQVLATVVESTEEFAFRRLSATVADFKRRGESFRETEILKAAKISITIAGRLAPEIKSILAEAEGKQPAPSPENLASKTKSNTFGRSKISESVLQGSRERNVTFFSNSLP